MKNKLILLFLILTSLSLAGCNTKENIASTIDLSRESADSMSQEKSGLTVAAASSLTEAFTEIGTAFETLNNCHITFSFASTATLSEQITNGAPFDVFAAANESAITGLDAKDLILSETRQICAIGRIGIATYKGRGIQATTMDDLRDSNIKIIAIASPEHAPYGLAAKQAIETAGLWETLEPKIVFGKNIAETLSYLTTGNADVAIIALSQKDEATLNYSMIDSDMHAPLTQAMAVLSDTDNEELARAFVAFVNGPEGKEIMQKYGFVTPGE
ncbi:Molybdate ABC transporter substrate-binding protein [Petrocella atlantisensis]|uniref:Molybdate ABC transporter substrate-binding protein n=1 Tax=Petrocella atlantisensis TaxID=2173034 RepID=A0A3P7S0G7_9FIRM|nr:molybdate ABC transporter substrate-binding protein [Petrocella atlantisensis]VDN48376.1 Molybdate ABC transporter substrate-binding protein [Petrocella atlantisensis]